MDTEDVGLIRLADSRISDEQQMLVADDQEDERRSRSISLDIEDRHALGRLGLSAQMSVNTLDRDSHRDDEVRRKVSGDGLSAKAGVILVSYFDASRTFLSECIGCSGYRQYLRCNSSVYNVGPIMDRLCDLGTQYIRSQWRSSRTNNACQ